MSPVSKYGKTSAQKELPKCMAKQDGGHGPDLAPLDPPLSVEHPISSLLLTMQWKLASLQYCVIQYTCEECNLFLKHGTRSRLMEIVENVSSGTYGMIQWWKSLPLLLTKLCLRGYDASGQSCLMQHSPNVYLRSMQSSIRLRSGQIWLSSLVADVLPAPSSVSSTSVIGWHSTIFSESSFRFSCMH